MNPTSPHLTDRTIRKLLLLVGVVPWAAAAACGGDSVGDRRDDADAGATGIAAMSVESYAEAVRTLSSDAAASDVEKRPASSPATATPSFRRFRWWR